MKFIVGGKEVHVPDAIWNQMEGPLPPEGFACDGCTSSPDEWRGFNLLPACIVHDFHYKRASMGPHRVGRMVSDGIMRRNLKRAVAFYGGGHGSQERIGWLYWGRVRIWGSPHYSWDEGEEDFPWWKRLAEVWLHPDLKWFTQARMLPELLKR